MEEASASARCAVRLARAEELSGIAAIYNQAITDSVATFDTEPWSRGDAELWLKEHGHPYAVFVAKQDGEVVGWASLGRYRAKAAYRYSVENSVYVRDSAQGNGIGGLLLARLLEAAADAGFRTVLARITDGNPASEALHRKLGFRTVGVERDVGRKFNRWLDVVVMQKVLTD